MNNEESVSRLKLIALINELPAGVDIYLTVRRLSREDFDRIPGTGEAKHGKSWSKDLEAPGVMVGLWTEEPPANVISWPTRTRPDLRLIG